MTQQLRRKSARVSATEYEFLLRFRLPDDRPDPESWLEALDAAGCDDATIGIGRLGRIALEFSRASTSAAKAIRSALADVERAIPGARLIEVAPDHVGVADIADVLGVSRQRARMVIETTDTFPLPIHDGRIALFHLAPVLEWLRHDGRRTVDAPYLETARAAMRLNLERTGA